MSNNVHPNVSVVRRIATAIQTGNLRDAAAAIAPRLVWHYFNPRLPHVAGDYVGLAGIEAFFAKVGQETGGSFKMEPVSATPIGDELVVSHGRLSLSLDGRAIVTDAVAVWRIQDERVTEVWDIPASTQVARLSRPLPREAATPWTMSPLNPSSVRASSSSRLCRG